MTDIRQKEHKADLQYIDRDLLDNKMSMKEFKSAAYALGIAVGFLVLSPLMPEIGSAVQSEAVFDVLSTVAFWMIGYSVVVGVTFFMFRANVKMVLMMLNWFVMPSVGLWAFIAIKDIFSGTGAS